jgi:deoxyribonuclease-4
MTTLLHLAATTFEYLMALPLDRTIDRLAAMGFMRVELLAFPPHVDLDSWSDADTRRIRRLADDAGVSFSSVGPSFFELNIGSTLPALREASISTLERIIRVSGGLGGVPVFVAAGRRGSLRAPSPEESERLIEDALNRLADVAESAGASIALEPIPYAYLASMSDIYAFVDRMGRASIRGMVDVANLNIVEPPAAAIRAARPDLPLVHLSDNDGVTFRHDAIGEGSIDFTVIADALRSVGYTGACVVETITEDPDVTLPRSLDRLRKAGWTTA